jgi:sugar/nucleoside kinase (ribokinase family)
MATQDTLLFASEAVFEEEAVTHIDDVVASPGGKGMVAAVAMSQAGGEVLPFALVGPGSRLTSQFHDALDTRHLHAMLDRDSHTWISVSAGSKMITFVALGAPTHLEEATARVADFVAEVDFLYVTAEHPTLLRAAHEAAARHNIPIGLNPTLPMLELVGDADPDLLAALVSRSSVVLCNDWEASRFLDSLGVEDWRDLEEFLPGEAVVTAGSAGGSYAEPPFDSWSRFDATAVERVRCVVGAGDTFNGAYLTARFVKGLSVAESCRSAADLAALKVSYRGSSLPMNGDAAAP